MRRTLLVLGLAVAAGVGAQGPRFAFTYQGELRVAGAPANGPYDFEFALYMQPTGGAPLATVAVDDRGVTSGLFSAELNFGTTPFAADLEYWLEPRVRDGASSGGYTPLLPRHKVTPAPRALSTYTVQAGGVDANAVQAGAIGVTKIADGAVTNDKIAAGTIAADRLAFTAGDVTAVSPGAGLTGGGASGDLTLGIADDGISGAMLPSGVIRSDELATNAVTSDKILAGAVTGDKVAADEVQRRSDELSTGCAGPNQSLKAIDAAGNVTCETDDGTAYSAGTGLSLAGATFAIDQAVVPRKDGAANQVFDGSTLVIDYANDRVGIGVSAPGQKLEVAGAVAGDTLAYRTARNGYVWIAAPDFTRNEVGEDDSIGFLNSSYLLPICAGPCDLNLHVGLNLPEEAAIDDFRCYFYDTHLATNITGNAFLGKRAYGDADATTVAGIGGFTTASANGMVAFAASFTPELATPSTHAYTLDVFPTFGTAPANTQRFYGCRVRYAYTQVAH